MYCRIIIMGRITADPELRNTPSNVSVTSFSVAVNRSYTNKNGERSADFFNVVAWRNQAEFICKYFKKGSCILIDGRLENREYIDKNGSKQRISEIIAENVSFTGERPSSYGSFGAGQPDKLDEFNSRDAMEQVNKLNSFENLDTGSFEEIEEDEDLPF